MTTYITMTRNEVNLIRRALVNAEPCDQVRALRAKINHHDGFNVSRSQGAWIAKTVPEMKYTFRDDYRFEKDRKDDWSVVIVGP